MGHQFDVVVFDLDGTLLDTSEGILGSVSHTIAQLGLEPLNQTQLKSFIGPPVQDSFRKYYHLHEDDIQLASNVFREHYKTVNLFKAKPYDGIYTLFDTLCQNHIQPAIATYKREDYALELLHHFQFQRYTEIMCGADMEGRYRKKDIIQKALQASGLANKQRAVMIGDSDSDGIGANTVGIPFIAVTYGFGFATAKDAAKHQPYAVANDVGMLQTVLLGGEE